MKLHPGLIELKVLQSTEGYEVSQQYQVMSIDASNIDLYEVEFPHEPINVVDARKMPTTGLSPIYFMSSFGVSLTCLGVLIVRYLNHEEVLTYFIFLIFSLLIVTLTPSYHLLKMNIN